MKKYYIATLLIIALIQKSFAVDYYVSPTGNNANDGLSSGNAWATIQFAVNSVSPGDRIFLQAGTYTENVTVPPTAISIQIIGAGKTSTFINPVSSAADVFTVRASGAAGSPLSITDMTIRDGGSGNGINIDISSGAYYEFKNLDLLRNRSGIRLENTTLSNILIDNCVFEENDQNGILADPVSLNALSVTNSDFSNNGLSGLSVNGDFSLSPLNINDLLLENLTLTNNGGNAGAGSGDLNVYLFNGNAVFRNITITNTLNTAHAGLQLRGWDNNGVSPTELSSLQPAGNISFENVSVNGQYKSPSDVASAFRLVGYSSGLENITFSNCSFASTGAADGQERAAFYLAKVYNPAYTTTELDLNDTELHIQGDHEPSPVYPVPASARINLMFSNNSPICRVDATGGNFRIDGISLNISSVDNLFLIEDRIFHAIDNDNTDLGLGGFVEFVTDNAFVTPNSFVPAAASALITKPYPDVNRAVKAASDGWTVNIQESTEPYNTEAPVIIDKSLTLTGNGADFTSTRIDKLTIDAPGKVLSIRNPFYITSSLSVMSGVIDTELSSDNFLVTADTCVQTGGNANGYIDGPHGYYTVSGTSSYSFNFLTGSGEYKPVKLSFDQVDDVPTLYVAEMHSGAAPSLTFPAEVSAVSAARYWEISNGGAVNFANPVVTLPVGLDDGPATIEEVSILKGDGSAWIDLGAETVTGLPGEVSSALSFTSFSPFVIASSSPVPDPPINLTATPVGFNQVDIAWVDDSSNEDGFVLERSVNSISDFIPIDTLTVDAEGVTDLNILDGTQYYYRARAYNASGFSAYGNTDDAVTPIKPPSDLQTDRADDNTITLTWTDNSQSEQEQLIERSNDAGTTFIPIATLGSDVSTYADAVGGECEKIVYRISAQNIAVGSSAFSNAAETSLPPFKPAPLSVEAPEPNLIQLRWTDNSNCESCFKIERALSEEGPFTQIGLANSDSTTYEDVTVDPSTRYYYRIKACGFLDIDDSPYSGIANAFTPVTDGDILPPLNLRGEPGHESAMLQWDHNPANEYVQYYEIFGFSVEYPSVLVGVTTTSSFVVTGLVNGLSRGFVVRAVDAAGIRSEFSNGVELTPSIILGEGDDLLGAQLRIYPNPNDGEFNLSLTELQGEDVNLEIFNTAGQRVFGEQFLATGNVTERQLQLKELSSGLYILSLQTSKGLIRKKFIVR